MPYVCDESPKKPRILNIQSVFMKHTILFFFSAPPFTAPRKHARASSVLPVTAAAHERFRFAGACMFCDSPALLPVM
jgi:hypothetical protein